MKNFANLLQFNARAALARRNLADFVAYNKADYQFNWHHTAICEALDKFQRGEIKKLMLFVPPQHGKQLSDSTPVLCIDGWKTHGDLKPGDFVFNRNGKPVLVKSVSPKTISEYEVTFTDGTTIEAHGNHEWVVFDRSQHKERILETRWLSDQEVWKGEYGKRGSRARFQVDNNTCTHFPERPVNIHPYLLGAWLGDGSKGKGCITHHPDDLEVIDKITDIGWKISATWEHKATKVLTTSFVGLYKSLSELPCFNEKHIPKEYLISSEQQRLELLAGLIDTDGYVYHKNGRVTFSNTNKRLIDDVKRLVISLGWRVSISKFDPITSTSGIEGKQIVYQLCFNPDRQIPTALKRKKLLNFKPAIRKRGIVSVVKKEGLGQGHCIQVDGGVYLAGETLIPTHNSELTTRQFPAFVLGKQPKTKIAVCSYSATLAQSFNRDIQRIIDNDPYHDVFPGTLLSESNVSTSAHGNFLRNADIFEVVNHRGFVKTVGVGGSLTGTPLDLGIIDDPFKDREEAMSSRIRDKVWSWYTDVFETRLHNGSQQLLIMTRWDADDLAGRILKRDNDWTVIVFQGINERHVPGDPRAIGEALWPERHSLERLLKVKANSPFTFNSLYQQEPKPSTEALVFPEWSEYDDEAEPDVEALIGLDFGFSNDPNGCVQVKISKKDMYLKELFYKGGLTNSQIAMNLEAVGVKRKRIVADSSEPKTIEEFKTERGYSMVGADKGKDSVNAGINWIKDFTLHVHKNSHNLKNELNNYQWVMVNGKATNVPIDAFNHLIDPTRYTRKLHKSKKTGTSSSW